MKTLDEVIRDFESREVIGEGDVYIRKGVFVSDFNTAYLPKNDVDETFFIQSNGLIEHKIGMDAGYKPITLSVVQNRTHDLTNMLSLMQEAVKQMLMHDPRWVYANYGAKMSQVNNSTYSVETERTSSGIPAIPDIVETVELYVGSDDRLEKLRFVTTAVSQNVKKELAYREIKFVYK